jgi:hypothetical protein
MEQRVTPECKLRMNWLAVLSFIFSFSPLVSVVLAIQEVISTIPIFLLAFGGFIVSMALRFLTPKRINKSYGKVWGLDFDVISIVTAVSLVILWAMYIPGALRMKQREKESAVKRVAYALQMCIEDYKIKHFGELPKSVREVGASLPGFIVEQTHNTPWGIKSEAAYLKKLENPLNSKQTYTTSGGGLVDGEPNQNGQIGYIAPKNDSVPYKIITYSTDYSTIADYGKHYVLLELVEERPDSSETKHP